VPGTEGGRDKPAEILEKRKNQQDSLHRNGLEGGKRGGTEQRNLRGNGVPAVQRGDGQIKVGGGFQRKKFSNRILYVEGHLGRGGGPVSQRRNELFR